MKNPQITAFTDAFAKTINPRTLGLERSKQRSICVLCSKPACQFKDAKSEREYRISGSCQQCQDDIFG